MSDVGPGPASLIRKRIETEIKRLEHMISNQELESLEIEQRIAKNQENIDASQKALEKQYENLAALDKDDAKKEVKQNG